jgi:uncharacterized protein YeeX (DUF496 family)
VDDYRIENAQLLLFLLVSFSFKCSVWLLRKLRKKNKINKEKKEKEAELRFCVAIIESLWL